MANTRFQHKRSSVSGVIPTTSDIAAGELGLNLADRKLFTSNGTAVFELGSNLSNLTVSGNLTVNTIIAYGSPGTNGQVLTSNGTAVFWDTISAGGFTNGQSISVNNFVISGTFTANGSTGANGQILISNGAGVYWGAPPEGGGGTVTSIDTGNGLTGGPITTSGTISVRANNGITANSSGLFVVQGTGTVVNATGVHVNSSYIGTLEANSATYLGNSSGTLANVSSWISGNAATAYTNATSYADTAAGTAYANAVANAAALYQTTAGLAANVATLTANAAGFLGNSSGTLANLSSWISGNSSTAYSNATVFASNASNINTGTIAEARLPFRMDQNVATTSTVSFAGLTVTGNLTVSGNYVVVSGNSVVYTDNMLYLNQGISANITNITSNGTHLVFTANNNYQVGWDVDVTNVNPSSYNGLYVNITAANATTFTVANTNTDTYVSGGVARGKSEANPDLGFAAGYNDGSYKHAGFFRDHSSGVWKVFDGYLPEPDTSVYIDQTNASFTIAPFQASELRVGNNTNYGVVNTTNFSGTANNALNLGGVSAASYQTNAGLAANVATLTANNSTNLNGQPASFYTNASNITSGTLSDARLSSAVVNTSGSFTLSGNFTYNANLTIATSGELIISNGAGIQANGSFGSSGQVLTSNGTGVYWSTASGGVNTAAQYTWTNTHIFNANVTVNSFFTVANSSATVAIFASNGNVGIGTASPTSRLQVNGAFAATTKSFLIDHPTKPGMILRYGSLEGPENGVYVRGRLTGTSVIELPDYWTALVNPDTITVNLTPIGRHQSLYVKSIANNKVYVGCSFRVRSLDFYFTVYGERRDVPKLVVEQ